MKLFVNGVLYDPEETPIVLLFDGDLERRIHAANLNNMQNRDGVRLYGIFPDSMPIQDRGLMLDVTVKLNDMEKEKKKSPTNTSNT